MSKNKDDSILAWSLALVQHDLMEPAKFASAGALAASPKSFATCGEIVSRKIYTAPQALDRSPWAVSPSPPPHSHEPDRPAPGFTELRAEA